MATDWRDKFVGRSADLELLKSAWLKAKAREPQVVSLIAESGLGKTRLVQEFFGWLSISEDKHGTEGYWPDSLSRVHNRRARRELFNINPELAHCAKDGREIPFLWWGIQLPDSEDEPQRVVTALSEYEYRLKLHLIAYLNAVRVAELQRDHAKSGGSALFDLGLNVAGEILPEVVLAAIPFGSLAFTVLSSLIGIGKWGYETAGRQEDINEMQATTNATDVLNAKRQDIADEILANLGVICHAPPKPLSAIPLVLVIDDAQWIGGDQSLCKLLHDLLHLAGTQKWPLMVIVTSWETEWKRIGEIDCGSTRFDSIRSLFCARGVGLVEHNLQPITQFAEVVECAFPGLTDQQREMIVSKAEGNALCLYDLLHHLEDKPQYFVARDKSAALTEAACQFIDAVTFDEVVRLRLQASPAHVQATLALASLQGMQFSGKIVTRAAQAIALDKAEQGLTEGENPYAFVAGRSADAIEFRARYYLKAANENLERLFDREAATQAFTQALRSVRTEEFSDPAEAEQAWTAQLTLFDGLEPADRGIAFAALANLASAAMDKRDYFSALAHAERWAIEWLSGKPGTSSMTVMVRIESILRELGNSDLALRFAEEILSIARTNDAAVRDGNASLAPAITAGELMIALERAATNLFIVRRYVEARALYEESAVLRADRHAVEPSEYSLRALVAASLQLGECVAQESGYKAALPNFQLAVEHADEFAAQARSLDAKMWLADALSRLGYAANQAAELGWAKQVYERAAAIIKTIEIDDADRVNLIQAERIARGLAESQSAAGEFAAAYDNATRAIDLIERLERIWPTPAQKLLQLRSLLLAGDAAMQIGRFQEGGEAFVKGVELSEPGYEAGNSPDLIHFYSLFGERAFDVLEKVSPTDALEIIEEVLAAKRKLVAMKPDFIAYADLGVILSKQADVLFDLQRADEARTAIAESADVLNQMAVRAEGPWQDYRVAVQRFNLGDLYRRDEKLALARACLDEALPHARRVSQELDSPDAIRLMSLIVERMGMIEHKSGNVAGALGYYLACMGLKDAIAARSESVRSLNDQIIIADRIATLAGELGNFNMAVDFRSREFDIRVRAVQRGWLPAETIENSRTLLSAARQRATEAGKSVDPVSITAWQPPGGWETLVPDDAEAAIVPTVSRNAFCSCGSGRRYKHCHGNAKS